MSYNYRAYNRRRRRGRTRTVLLGLLLLLAAGAIGGYVAGVRSIEDIPGSAALFRHEAASTPGAAGQGSRTATTAAVADAPSQSATPGEDPAGSEETPAPGAMPTGPDGAPARATVRPTDAAQVTAAIGRPTGTPRVATRAAATPTPEPTKRSRRATATPRPARPRAQAPRSYTVKPGDTLFGVAERYGVPFQTMADANGMPIEGEVYIGQRLFVPTRLDPEGIDLPGVRRALDPPKVAPLAAYAPGMVRYLAGRDGETSAAVYVPETDTLYAYNPEQRYLMASTVKVPIMLTQLAKQYRGDRDEYAPGTDLLPPMIVVSDNDAADRMFALVGGAAAVRTEVRARGLTDIRIASDSWGLSTTTASDMALLMRSLYYGERLNPALRGIAVGLMGGVVDEQRWGVPEGLGEDGWIAFKGGWLPTDDGWQVHQTGIAELGGQNVIFAVYTSGQPTEEYGRETLEGAARALAEARGGQ